MMTREQMIDEAVRRALLRWAAETIIWNEDHPEDSAMFLLDELERGVGAEFRHIERREISNFGSGTKNAGPAAPPAQEVR